jgi:hypothetical protein
MDNTYKKIFYNNIKEFNFPLDKGLLNYLATKKADTKLIELYDLFKQQCETLNPFVTTTPSKEYILEELNNEDNYVFLETYYKLYNEYHTKLSIQQDREKEKKQATNKQTITPETKGKVKNNLLNGLINFKKEPENQTDKKDTQKKSEIQEKQQENTEKIETKDLINYTQLTETEIYKLLNFTDKEIEIEKEIKRIIKKQHIQQSDIDKFEGGVGRNKLWRK